MATNPYTTARHELGDFSDAELAEAFGDLAGILLLQRAIETATESYGIRYLVEDGYVGRLEETRGFTKAAKKFDARSGGVRSDS